MKLKTILKTFMLTCCTTLILWSCDGFFNPVNPTVLTEEDSFSDYLSSRAAVNGLYALLQDVMDAYVVSGELKGDMLKTSENADSDLRKIYNFDYSLPNKYLDIRPFYTIISNSNDVIMHLKQILESGTSSYHEELKNMHAEAVILRAWVYFYILRNYSTAPYITEDYTASGASENIEEWLSSTNAAPVQLDELIAETEAVVADLDPTRFTESEFFNIASSNAFLGEMYLWKDDYENAIRALHVSAHSANNFNFILDLDTEKGKWSNIFKGDESAADEMMLKIIFDIGQKQENNLLNLFSSIGPEEKQLVPVNGVVNNYNSDVYRFNGTFKNSDEVGKYTRSPDNPFTSDMPVILYRAADVHLMLAEAYNRIGKIDLALDLVNNGNDSLFTQFSKGIRGRVAMGPIKVEGENIQDSIIDLENKIIRERALELAFEGKRWYDLIRIARRRNDAGFIMSLMEKKYPGLDTSIISDFYENPENWYVSAPSQ